MYRNNNPSSFSQREIAAALQLWNRAAISLLDIRHNLISPEEALYGYQLPASAFLYTSGKAEVSLNDMVYPTNRFGLFHGGRGTELTLIPAENWLEYYIVLYKTGEPPFQKREYAKLLEQANPFRQQYGFSPRNPLFFADQLKRMFERWKGPTLLNLFYGKADFYQFVCGVYQELEQGNIHIFEPDVVAMAVRFLEANYHGNVSIQEMCNMLGISYSHFHRIFKQKTTMSPQEYLIHTRLNAARASLENSNATIREIAERCGFIDESRFYRLFMKNEKLSPGRYRELSQSSMRDSTIGNAIPFPYNWESQVSLDELKGKGATYMFKQMKGKAVVAAALSLMLLMSACGTATANGNGAASTPTSVVTSQVETEGTEPVEEGIRTISTVMGDVEVPMDPQRIVSYYISGNVYAFDIEPVGIDSASEGAGFFNLVKEAQVVDFSNSEEVMTLEPDLIILSNDYFYEDMSKIAPTIIVPYGTSIEEQITFLGEILNREEKAEEIIANYHQAIEENKKKIESSGLLDKRVTVVEGGAEAMRVHGSTYIGGPSILYSILGFKAPDNVEEDILIPGKSGQGISLEALPQYVEDILVQFVWEGMDDMSANAVWTSIPAVKNQQLIELPFSMAHYPDILSQIQQMEYLTDALLALQ